MQKDKSKQAQELIAQAASLGLSPDEERELLARAAVAAAVAPVKKRRDAGGTETTETDADTPRGKSMDYDPYLVQSQTVQARPTQISHLQSMFYEMALPNEYIMRIGVADAKPVLGGTFWRPGRRFLKFPAAVQTVYFVSDNANKNYQGLRVDGYACWRIDSEKPELAARALDFSDQKNPMANTNRILRTICTEAIRHIIANITIDDALTKKDEVGRDLKAQLGRIERTWGILFDQVGIERVTILSEKVFADLQQKMRDDLRLSATRSKIATDQEIEGRQAEYTQKIERLRSHTEKEARVLKAHTETEIHSVELSERAQRETHEREAAALRARAEAEAKIIAVHEDARVTGARMQAETAKAEADGARAQRQAELVATLHRREQDLELERLAAEQSAELERARALAIHDGQQQRERAQAEHEVEMLRLERFRLQEGISNGMAPNRIKAAFVDKLPEIAAAQKIDKYTVYAGATEAPLTALVERLVSLVEDKGVAGLVRGKSE